jgi:hypothetical protein
MLDWKKGGGNAGRRRSASAPFADPRPRGFIAASRDDGIDASGFMVGPDHERGMAHFEQHLFGRYKPYGS